MCWSTLHWLGLHDRKLLAWHVHNDNKILRHWNYFHYIQCLIQCDAQYYRQLGWSWYKKSSISLWNIRDLIRASIFSPKMLTLFCTWVISGVWYRNAIDLSSFNHLTNIIPFHLSQYNTTEMTYVKNEKVYRYFRQEILTSVKKHDIQ